jgi:Bacterial regulatory helix-turn-helix protein, lysR family
MDKFAAMRVFVRIADAGNLSAAGRQLGLSLTSVSRRLMALEEVLGTALVERTTRHLSLTESGRSPVVENDSFNNSHRRSDSARCNVCLISRRTSAPPKAPNRPALLHF